MKIAKKFFYPHSKYERNRSMVLPLISKTFSDKKKMKTRLFQWQQYQNLEWFDN